MRHLSAIVLGLLTIAAGVVSAPSQADPDAVSGSVLLTEAGPAVRVGPSGGSHAVGLLANGSGAFGIAIADDGTFLAFTCGMRPEADAWFSGDWYRGQLDNGTMTTVQATSADGDQLELVRDATGGVSGRLISADGGESFPIEAAPALTEDGVYRRDDADGIFGAVALPGNTVCAVKRTVNGDFEPAGTMPY